VIWAQSRAVIFRLYSLPLVDVVMKSSLNDINPAVSMLEEWVLDLLEVTTISTIPASSNCTKAEVDLLSNTCDSTTSSPHSLHPPSTAS
jgi:hypothetical protein